MSEEDLAVLPSLRFLSAVREAFLLPPPHEAAARKRLQRYLSGGERPSETAVTALVQDTVERLRRVDGIGVELPCEVVPDLTKEFLTLLGLADYKVFERKDGVQRLLEDQETTLGFRMAGYYLLLGEPPPRSLPRWIAGERDTFLEDLLLEGRTRKALFDSLDKRHPAKRVLEGLLAGGRPRSDETLASLARLAAHGEFARTYGRLRVHYAMRALRDDLAERCGAETIRAVSGKIWIVAWYVYQIVLHMKKRGDLGDEEKAHKALVHLMLAGPAAASPRAQCIPAFTFRVMATSLKVDGMSTRLREALDAVFFPPWRTEAALKADTFDEAIGTVNAGTIDFRLRTRLLEVLSRRGDGGAGGMTQEPAPAEASPCEALLRVARSHVERDDFVGAERVLRGAPSGVREDPHVRLQLARVLLHRDSTDDALLELEQARPGVKDDPEFHVLLAVLLERAGHPQKAKAAATRAAELGRPWIRALLEAAPELVHEEPEPRSA